MYYFPSRKHTYMYVQLYMHKMFHVEHISILQESCPQSQKHPLDQFLKDTLQYLRHSRGQDG